MTAKIAILIQGGNDAFLPPLRAWFRDRFEIREYLSPDSEDLREALAWADLTWVEWVQDTAVAASGMERRGKLVMRLHSFEAYTSQVEAVDWQSVDALAVVAPHVTDILSLRVPDIRERTEVFVLPNGVDTDRFTIPERKTATGKIAFVGQIRHTKNLPMVLQCFAAAREAQPDLTLHLAGQYAGTELEVSELALYLDHMIHAMGLAEAVTLHGHVEDIPAFLADKDALISASLRESFGYNIAEAMACGVRPAIHNFPGAGSLYPEELIFNTVAQARDILTADGPAPDLLRRYVLSRWPLALQHAKLAELSARVLS
ncbi:glycosyltransferase [Pseudodesulfovibrio cashew]|uniref:Glycosyltransferase n=1 Tax=Pseudodesulfovibrio cashew TaxID=2678688 RepID=A0A6I6J9N3_9BACT|nr:glycosyltransferase [Pseudodesulfovibrio cashew]QGY38741.1 glycosyltransferase [Pseudodesulfovibrio cashew]